VSVLEGLLDQGVLKHGQVDEYTVGGLLVDRAATGQRGVDAHHRFAVVHLDEHELGRILGEVRVISDDDGEGLPREPDPVSSQEGHRRPHELLTLQRRHEARTVQVRSAEDGAYPGEGSGRRGIDAAELAGGLRAAHEREVQRVWMPQVVDEASPA